MISDHHSVSRISMLFGSVIFSTCLSAIICAAVVTADQYVKESPNIASPQVEHYGLLPEYRSVSLSPDGRHIALIQRKGTQDFFVVRDAKTLKMIGGFNADKYNARHIFFASNDHVILLNSQHRRMPRIRGSFEQENAFVYDLKSKNVKVLLAHTRGLFPAQSLTNIVGMNVATNELYMAAYSGNLSTSFRMDLFRVSLETGKGKVYAKGNRYTVDWFVDHKGRILAREDFNSRKNKHQVFSKTSGEWQLIYENEIGISDTFFQAVSHNGTRLLYEDSLDNHTAIFSIALSNGDIQGPIYQREATDVSHVITDINRQLVAVKYSGFVPDYDFLEVQDNKVFDLLTSSFSDNSVHYLSHTSDHTQWLILVSGNDGAGAYKIYDHKNNKLLQLMSQYPAVEAIGEIRAVNIKARDGMSIPSIITMPTTVSEYKNLPLIALPHGGPESHDSLQFDWLSQYLAAKDYMVLQPNFRGSDGFGFALRDGGHGEWGGKMQDDVSDGIAALIKAGYVDPDRVCIMGASYGGYSALAGGAFSPELYRCVIAIASVSDLPLMLKAQKFITGSNHWVLSYWENNVGASDKHSLGLISPINAVEKFQAPVLLIHGKHDSVVPIQQSSLMYKALQKANKDVEFIELEGEDHWLSNSATRLELLDAVDKFLDKHNPVTLP